MHEMSLMFDIIKLVSVDAKVRGFSKVEYIEVIVGDFSNVLPDALELAFYHLSKEGLELVDENTELKIIREEAKAECRRCLTAFKPDYQIAICTKCGYTECVLVSGETFRVEAYEGSEGK